MEILSPTSQRGRTVLTLLGAAVLRLALMLVAFSWPGLELCATETPTVEASRVKAAYLIKFTRYVSWSTERLPNADSPIVIGVSSEGAVSRDLDAELRRLVNDRPIRWKKVNSPGEAVACHVVFLTQLDASDELAWLEKLRDLPVLTVVDSGRSDGIGAVIRLIMEGKRLRFDVDCEAMERAGLRISADMLRSARAVKAKKGSAP